MMRTVLVAVVCVVVSSLASGAHADERLTNGNLDAGLSGWTQQRLGAPTPCVERGWEATVAGPCPPPPMPPASGGAAYDGWGGIGFGATVDDILYQDFSVPTDTSSAVLSWSDAASWRFMSSGSASLEVAITTPTGTVLQVVATRAFLGLDNFDPAWAPHVADLTALISAHRGETLRLRFRLTSSAGVRVNESRVGIDSVSLVTTACGNGTLDGPEQCDDGNWSSGDCCSSLCLIESRGTLCRAATAACDLPEFCDGTTTACPPDALAAAATLCRGVSQACDAPEVCDGTTAACPTDGAAAAGTLCRGIRDACDAPELCDGTAFGCPADAAMPAGVLCRGLAGACDVAEACDGSATACPTDAVAAAGTLCRGVADPCDASERCDGSARACPTDASAADGTACRDSLTCNGSETCVAGACTAATSPLDCDDGDACTADSCAEPSGCAHAAIARCCSTDSDCDDGNRCTADACGAGGAGCSHEPIVGCGGDAGPLDAGPRVDASVATPDTGTAPSTTAGGCSCRAAAPTPTSPALLALVGVAWGLVRRRRAHRSRRA